MEKLRITFEEIFFKKKYIGKISQNNYSKENILILLNFYKTLLNISWCKTFVQFFVQKLYFLYAFKFSFFWYFCIFLNGQSLWLDEKLDSVAKNEIHADGRMTKTKQVDFRCFAHILSGKNKNFPWYYSQCTRAIPTGRPIPPAGASRTPNDIGTRRPSGKSARYNWGNREHMNYWSAAHNQILENSSTRVCSTCTCLLH